MKGCTFQKHLHHGVLSTAIVETLSDRSGFRVCTGFVGCGKIQDTCFVEEISCFPMDYLGIDYGSKFIGLAWSSDDLKVVVPLKALRVHSMEQVLKDLQKIVNERGCDAFVIGLPIHANGTEGQRVKEVKYFAERLKQHFNLKIYFQDERFSTQTACTLTGTDSLSLRQAKAKKEKGVIDSTAAAVILEEWMGKDKKLTKK